MTAADANGAVFKNPARALRALRTHYGEGIWAVQKELYMLPLTPYTYNLYGMYGWQLTEGTEEELRQILDSVDQQMTYLKANYIEKIYINNSQ